MMPISVVCLLHLAVVCADPPGVRIPPVAVNEDEAFLQTHAKIATDNASLLKLLHKRAEVSDDPSRLAAIVEQLGSASFEKRTEASRFLIACGEVALPFLRKRVENSDLEFTRRGKACIEVIEKEFRPDWSLSVARLLVARKPAGTFEALLAFLPCTDDPDVEEEMYYGLDELIALGQPIPESLVEALQDKASARRAVAACIIGRRGNNQQQTTVRKIMETDRDSYVRLRAAQGLLATRDRTAIPALIDLLRDPSVKIGWQAEEMLRWSAEIPPASVFGAGTKEERNKCHQAWAEWWKESAPIFAWPRPHIRPSGPGMVLLLIRPELDHKPRSNDYQMWLIGCDGLPRYHVPYSDRLVDAIWIPDGGFLTVLSPKRIGVWLRHPVEEVNLEGKILQSFSLEYQPKKWRRSPNGHVEFVMNAAMDITCDRTGKVLRTAVGPGTFMLINHSNESELTWPLRNGNTLIYGDKENAGRLVEVTPGGRAVWETIAGHRPYLAFPLVRFGFSAVESKATSLDSLEHRLYCLSNPFVPVRAHALHYFMSRQLDEKTWKAVLRVAQSDEDKSNRCLALRILAKSPSDCRKCIREFVDMLGEESWEFRVPLRVVFETIDQKEIVSALIRVAEEKEGPKAAVRRANALYQLKSFWRSQQLDEMVLKACYDREAIVQKTAVEILNHNEYAGGAKFVPAMIHLAQHQDDQTAMLAVRVLGRLGKDAETARPLLLKMLRERKELRAEIVQAFNGLKPRDPSLVPVLLPYLGEKEDGKVIAAVLASLALDHRPKEALQPLIRLLARKDLCSYGNDAVVFEILAKYGPEAKEAVPQLKQLLIDYSSWRRPIATCLEKIDPVAAKEARDCIRSMEEAEDHNRLNPPRVIPIFPERFPEK